MMIDMLLDCSIFVAVDAGLGNYIQLSGEGFCDFVSMAMYTDFPRVSIDRYRIPSHSIYGLQV